jgi:hypothetical protein
MRTLLLALTLLVPTYGCGSKTEPKADQAAAGTPSPSNREADDKATEVEGARGEAKTVADNAKEAADKDAAKAHAIVHDELQARFDAADRRFNALKEKAAKATGAKKATADAQVSEVTKREATVMASIAKLRDTTGAQWDPTKTQVETDSAALDKSIDALEKSLR